MNDVETFEAQRGRLRRLAYRMLGSVAEAEDVVQDAWLRWRRTDQAQVTDPAAWLVRTATRLCLDRLKSARARREVYVGAWLPEPLVEAAGAAPAESADERAEDVSVTFLLALERLSPLERAVFLLREVFDQDYGRIAAALDRSEAACRQLAARAKAHVREARPRFEVERANADPMVAAFMQAARDGDPSQLAAMLADDAVLISDGGGKRSAALNPILGAAKIIRFLTGISRKYAYYRTAQYHPARVNGLPGLVMTDPDGPQTIAFDLDAAGRVCGVYIVRNPDKLGHIGV